MLTVIMLNVIMLSVVMLSVVMLNVVMLSVVAPFFTFHIFLASLQSFQKEFHSTLKSND